MKSRSGQKASESANEMRAIPLVYKKSLQEAKSLNDG